MLHSSKIWPYSNIFNSVSDKHSSLFWRIVAETEKSKVYKTDTSSSLKVNGCKTVFFCDEKSAKKFEKLFSSSSSFILRTNKLERLCPASIFSKVYSFKAGTDLKKKFWSKFTHSFSKLDCLSLMGIFIYNNELV